jgi:tetratricopeptide (TPR) repeat protein
MRPESRIRLIVSLFVFLVAFVTYWITSAPTVSFWDCGELIAASNILGNPHPPGNPLFTLLARAFILVMPFQDIGFRVNVISVLSSALMVTMVFLFTVKLLDLVFEGKLSTFTNMTSGVIAAFLVTFSDTIWFSAVEAEVYGVAMLIVMAISWLTLYWFEHKGTKRGNRALLMITYLGFLGMGIHPFAFITMPVVGLFLLIADKDMRINFPLWISGILLLSVVYSIGNFQWFALASLLIGLAGWAMSGSPDWKARWNLSIWMTLVAVVGFSSYLYVPIRSSVHPEIDEGQPHTYKNFKEYLERKQYGSEGMLTRAMHRRGQLAHQLLVHPHMGYGGYMFAQYLPWKQGETRTEDDEAVIREIGGKKVEFQSLHTIFKGSYKTQYILFLLFQFPFLFGGYLAYKRRKPLGLYILMLYGATSFGLVFYMNFADGTGYELRDWEYWKSQGMKPDAKPDPVHLEVRDRDYFFTPGFIFMGVLFGVASAFAMRRLQDLGNGAGGGLSRGFGVAAAVLAAVVPAWSNWKEHDRSAIFMPWDYAYNLLNSCRPNAVLFTNGDNDTFPLWYMQAVEKVRTDVRVINLSLVNTNWYIHQLKEHSNAVKIGFKPEEIDAMEPQPWKYDKPVGFRIPNSKVVAEIQPRGYLRVQDIMVLHVVQNNYPERPMQFAVTVGDENMMGLQKWVKMEGMVYTLVEEPANKAIDPVLTAKLIDSVYRFRKLGDSTVYIDPNTEGLLTNYSATNFRMVMWAQDQIEAVDQKIAMAGQVTGDSVVVNLDSLKVERANYMATAEKYLKFNANILPREWRTHYYAAQLYMGAKEFEKAETSLKKGLDIADDPKPFLMNLVDLYLQQNQTEKANALLGTLKTRFPQDFEVWYSLAEMYQRRGDYKTAKSLLSTWLEGNPAHQYAGVIQQTIQELSRREQAALPPPVPVAGKPDSAKPAETPQGKDTAHREDAKAPAKG